MRELFGKVKNTNKSRLASQIRLSYIVLLLPNLVFMIYAFYNLYLINARYNDMLNSVVVASEFSLDFKDDFDYETYLLIVGNVMPEDSNIPSLLADARGVVNDLQWRVFFLFMRDTLLDDELRQVTWFGLTLFLRHGGSPKR